MELNYIKRLVLYMHLYQKQHNIKGECTTNCQYLYDCIKNSFPYINVTIRAVCVLSKYQNRHAYTVGHLVIILNINKKKYLFDPSYQICCHQEKRYFYDFNKFVKEFCDSYLLTDKDEFKRLLNLHINFIKKADKINNNNSNMAYVHNKEFYNNQADYIEKACSK